MGADNHRAKKPIPRTLILALALFLILLVPSAHAQLAVSPDTISINKTFDKIHVLSVNITNTEPFDFHNIQLDSPHAKMSEINILPFGATIQHQINITTNEDINLNLRIKGFYETDIGASNQTFERTINANSVQNCNQESIIEGDNIRFINEEQNFVVTISNNNGVIHTIPADSSILVSFPIKGEYVWDFRLSNAFDIQTCIIQVRDTTGLVNDRNLDAVLNVNVNTEHAPTTISTNLFQTSYTMDFFDEKTDIIKITNTGNNIASDIHLEADWFAFDKNDFDLGIGEDINVEYTISPINDITQTSQTNQTYERELKITGNFETQTIGFDIKINHAEITGDEFNITSSSLIDIITDFCETNPEICGTAPKIIYRYIDNGTAGDISINVSKNQLGEIFKTLGTVRGEIKRQNNFDKELSDSISSRIQNIENNLSLQIQQMQSLEQDRQNTNNVLLIGFITFMSFVVLGMLGGIIYIVRKQINRTNAENWGEPS